MLNEDNTISIGTFVSFYVVVGIVISILKNSAKQTYVDIDINEISASIHTMRFAYPSLRKHVHRHALAVVVDVGGGGGVAFRLSTEASSTATVWSSKCRDYDRRVVRGGHRWVVRVVHTDGELLVRC